jgi:hypothetical protein
VLLSWDRRTLNSLVQASDGVLLGDPPVLAAVDALALQAGDRVGLLSVGGRRVVCGRLVGGLPK